MKLFSAFLILFLVTACTPKSRDEKFGQGQGEDLLNVSAFADRKAELTTSDIKNELSSDNYTKETRVFSANGEKLNSYSPVNYTSTSAELKGDLILRIKPNAKFDLIYKLDEKFLKIYLIASPQDIDRTMVTYGEPTDTDKIMVPLMGYPVKGFFRVETVKNDNDEPTKRKGEIAVNSLSQASYFRLDWNGFEVYQALLKTDVFPSKYFRGEWFLSETVVAAPEENSSDLGFKTEHNSGFIGTSVVKFSINPTSLKVLNLNIDDRLKNTLDHEDTNLTTLVTIPAKTVAFRSNVVGAKTGLKEETREDINWNQRQWITLDLNSVISESFSGGDKLAGNSNQVVGVEVNDNYFSFTIHEASSNKRIKFAFLRLKDSTYQAKRVFPTDMKKFGFFVTSKNVFIDYKIRREDDLYKNTFINRFNPVPEAGQQQRVIKFYLTKSSPNWTYNIAKTACDEWDKAFKTAGTQVSVQLADNSERVDLGDIRYNQINMVESLAGGGLLGYGPSLANSRTGEIISATANIHVTPIRGSLIEEIKNYMRSKNGELSGGYIPGLGLLSQTIANSSDPAAGDESLLRWDVTSLDKTRFLNPKNQKITSQIFMKKASKAMAINDFSVTGKNVSSDIKKLCPEVTAYLKTLGPTTSIDSNKELTVLESCSRTLSTEKIISTLIHEMGHNFGLMHNFAGSVDKANFYTPAKGEIEMSTSSIMEYTNFDQQRLNKPGLYDIAAIRFGYANAIELKGGKIVALNNPQASIDTNVGLQNIKEFKYCDDIDAEVSINPLCRRFDVGTTPLEVVNHFIAEYNTSVALNNYRFDKIKAPSAARLADWREDNIFLPMRSIYDQWRLSLARFMGQDRKYLQKLTIQEYNQKLKEMSVSPQFKEDYAAYKPAADVIYAFFKQLAFLPDRFCIVTKKSDNKDILDLVNFPQLRENIYFKNKISASTCADQIVVDQLKLENKTAQGEVGHFLNDVRFDLSPQNMIKVTGYDQVLENIDIVGMKRDRLYAMLSMASRANDSYYLNSIEFFPNLMDEPTFRNDLLKTVAQRALYGISQNQVPSLGSITKGTSISIPPFFPKFNTEAELIGKLYSLFMAGLAVPGDTSETMERRLPIEGSVFPAQLLKDASQSVKLEGGLAFTSADSTAVLSQQFVKTVQGLIAMKDSQEISDLEARKIIERVMPAAPPKSKAAINLADLVPFYGEAQAIIQDPSVSNSQKIWFQTIFRNDLENITAAIQKIQESFQDQKPTQQMLLDEAAKLDMIAFYKENSNTAYSLYRENIEPQLTAGRKAFNSSVQEYKENATEYEGQLKMLHNIMSQYK